MKGAFSFLTQRSTIALCALGLALLAAPFIVDRYVLSIILLSLLGAYLGQAWNILMGYCGLLSLGHALYVGVGAYASAVLFVKYGIGPWLGVFVAIALCVALAALIGWLGFRFRIEGVYFALLTIAFAEIVRIGFDNWPYVGGAAGFFLPVNASLSDQWWNLRGGPFFFYYLALAMTAASLLIAAALRASRLGHAFLAIREDPTAARALGVDINRTRFLALFISAGMTGVAGVYTAFWTNNLFPAQVLETSKSIEIILAPIIGGLGTLMGPVVGALILVPLGSALTDGLRALGFNAPGVKALVYGLVLMAIIAVAPNGIWPWIARKLGLEGREP
ncbi:MAG: branched-chain amino acid ABC transporter permease [Rhodoblastus sp.]